MGERKPPKIRDFLDEIERDRRAREDEFLRAAAERRRAVEHFQGLAKEVIEPVARELERELRRRRHVTKVRRGDRFVQVRVAVHARQARHGSVRFELSEKNPKAILLQYEGIEIVPDHFEVDATKLDRELATRAVLRLVEGLMKAS